MSSRRSEPYPWARQPLPEPYPRPLRRVRLRLGGLREGTLSQQRDLLSQLVVAFDRWQRRRLGIWSFSDDPECIVRLGVGTAHERVELSDGTVVTPGETIGLIHLWNERIPRIPAEGPSLAWARQFKHLLVHSLALLAHHLAENPDLDHIRAFGGKLPLVYSTATVRFLRHLGLEVFEPSPPRGAMERAVDLVARLWTFLLRRAFNPESVRNSSLSDLRRRSVWFSRRRLIRLYAPEHAVSDGTAHLSESLSSVESRSQR